MPLRTILIVASALLALVLSPRATLAQESPARRLASIASVAVDEYQKGVDERGRIVLQMEFDEAVAFYRDALGLARMIILRFSPDIKIKFQLQ